MHPQVRASYVPSRSLASIALLSALLACRHLPATEKGIVITPGTIVLDAAQRICTGTHRTGDRIGASVSRDDILSMAPDTTFPRGVTAVIELSYVAGGDSLAGPLFFRGVVRSLALGSRSAELHDVPVLYSVDGVTGVWGPGTNARRYCYSPGPTLTAYMKDTVLLLLR